MKKSSFFIIVGFYLFLALVLGSLLLWNRQLQPVDKLKKELATFVVDKGESVSEITSRLKQQNLIRNEPSFKVWLVCSGIAKKIKAGSYYLSSSMTAKEIAVALTKGANDRWVTIIEGLRFEQIGELLIRKGFAINPKEWEGKIKKEGLEGRLFPDTYLFPKGATSDEILKIIEKNFQKKVQIGLKDEFSQTDLKFEEVLILASIVERETKKDKDRAIVAGILLKRLENKWPLQVDASVQYAVASQKCSLLISPCDWWPNKLSKQDLQIRSPYNTYLYLGLPPGPICSSGISSIKATLKPVSSPYWYYLSDSDGLIHYARTNEEQQQNIQKYLK